MTRFVSRASLAALMFLLASSQTASAQAGADTSMSGAAAETAALARADSLRRVVLRYATFAGFADTSCAPGDIRTFEKDTTDVVKNALMKLELLVLSYGAYTSLENEAGRALMRALVRLEGGGPGPRWDLATGTGPRAFNPVLPVELFNPETKKCQMTPGLEPGGIVLPALKTFEVPRDSGAFDFAVTFGPTGMNDLRNFYFSRHRTDTAAVLNSVRVNAYGMWQNYAIVGVVRQQERRGVLPNAKEATGAVYAFHRVGSEWRLLALIRNH